MDSKTIKSEQMKELDELIEKYEEGNMSLITLKSELLRLFMVNGSSYPDDFWKQEYDEAVKEIGNLQDQLKDAESAIRDMESELRSRY